jgi:hemerythrin-like domain-containing protein
MKRHKSLYPLSHDHHHALVQARNLRLASSTPDVSLLLQTAAKFIEFWDASLQIHFRQEEEILLPVFSKCTSPERPEIIETLKQHTEIRELYGELRRHVEQERPVASQVAELAHRLEQHIRYEESDLFPAIESAVPEEELWEVNRLLTGG